MHPAVLSTLDALQQCTLVFTRLHQEEGCAAFKTHFRNPSSLLFWQVCFIWSHLSKLDLLNKN